MKRGEMQKKFFRFLDRLPYFPFYRTIVLNVKVKIGLTQLGAFPCQSWTKTTVNQSGNVIKLIAPKTRVFQNMLITVLDCNSSSIR